MLKTKLDRFLQSFCEKHLFSGSLRVTMKDEIIYERHIGLADYEKRIPFSAHSMFTFYSLSKPFCAIGLMKLKDRGFISLDEHPSKYIPEASNLDPRISIFQMLHHTSGIPDFEQTKEFAATHRPGIEDNLSAHLLEICNYQNYFAPGSNVKYTNINFILSALLIEAVSGMKYADYMRQEVFLPLGMETAIVDKYGLYVNNRVVGHEEVDGNLQPVERSIDWMLGAGDIIGTVDDVYCLNKAIKNQQLLSSESWNEILSPLLPITNFGMGCWVSDWHGKKRITHSGGHRGFRTLHTQIVDDDFDIILLSNVAWKTDIRDYISRVIYEAYYGQDDNICEIVEMDKGYAF